MAEAAGEEQQSRFAVDIRRGEVRLQHRAAVGIEQPCQVIGGGEFLRACIALRIFRSCADGRLDDEFRRVGMLGQERLQRRQWFHLRFDETCRHYRHAACGQVVQ